MLGKAGFGELGIIQNTVNTFQVFAVFGLGITATKFIAQLRTQDPARAGRILALSGLTAFGTGAVFSSALFFSATMLASRALVAPQLAGPLRIGAGLLFFAALNGAQTGALAGLEAFRVIARVNLISGLTTFFLMVGGAVAGGLSGILWGLLISAAANWLITHMALRKCLSAVGIAAQVRGCWQERGVLWAFSVPAVLAGVAVAAAVWGSNAILVNQPGGYADMGAYNAVMRIKQVPETVLLAILAPILPVLSSAHAKKDIITFGKTARLAFALSIALLIPVALIQIAVPALSLLPYGPEFKGYSGVVRWLMFQTAIVGVCFPIGTIQVSMGRMWLGATYNLSWAIVSLAFSFLLVPLYQGPGLAAASALTYVVTVVPATMYLFRHEAAYFRSNPFWKLLFGFPALSAACWLIGARFQPVVAGVAGAVSVVVTLYVAYSLIKTSPYQKH
jgi:O-antigen/teichoic acid export membrane protein